MIYILTSAISSRLEYVLSFIFKDVYSVEYSLILPENAPPDRAEVLIVYGDVFYGQYHADSFMRIPSCGLLFEKKSKPIPVQVIKDNANEHPYFFSTGDKDLYDLPFDIFSMIFYCLSRYEEYLPYPKDQYGRFSAYDSLAFKSGFLHIPLIDVWLDVFMTQLQVKCRLPMIKNQHFGMYPTIDIDRVWAFAHNGIRIFPGMMKDMLLGRFKTVRHRIHSLQNPSSDPFYTFDYLDKILEKSPNRPLYFILFANQPDSRDINHRRDSEAFQNWLSTFSQNHDIGMHPSFQSHESLPCLLDEKGSLENQTGKKINSSRQHYILLFLPKTYQNLLETGITDDYSMGFADAPGYRASTGYSFYWYDISQEKRTHLRVHPFQIMDVTLKKYKNFTPGQAMQASDTMIAQSKKSDSPLRFIWHNSSFYTEYGWKNWYRVFEQLVRAE